MNASETSNGSGRDKETVKVVVRCRPLFGKELVEGRKSIVTIDQAAALISLKCPDNDQQKSFTFDSVYDENTSQRQFYDESAYPLVESIFEGYNGTIFAYGQTGCGKTHTMQGKESPSDLRGVIPLSFDHIFDTINADTMREYMVRASYLEIYNEDIRDLLSDDTKRRLDLKEAVDGTIYVKDLTEVVVRDVQSLNKVMNRGLKNRTIGATLMNEGSSRSHSIFTIVVETNETSAGQDHFKAGKLNLVDLAGSERQSKTGATGNRLKEGCKINLSLSALGNVISALVDGKGKHIPYRDSKLTRLLQDSLGGNTKTLMVAAVSPADYNYDETLSTLRYANRAKNIKNKPIVNEDPKDAKLREYKEEIERLRKMLESQSQSRDNTINHSNVVETFASDECTELTTDGQEIAKYQQEAAEMFAQAKCMREEANMLQAQNEEPQQSFNEISEETMIKPKSTGVLSKLSPLLSLFGKQEQASSTDLSGNTNIQGSNADDSTIQNIMQEATRMDAEAKEMMVRAQIMMDEATERQLTTQSEAVMKNKISDAFIKEQEELRQMNQSIADQRDRIGHELEQTQVAMQISLREKEALHSKLKKIESHILGGPSGRSLTRESGNTQDADSEMALLKQQVEYRRAQIKLREKAKLQAKNEAMQRALALEKQQVEQELKSAQEAAQIKLAAARKKELKYKSKLKCTRQEIADLFREFEQERKTMLDTIREQTKEAKLLKQLVDLFLPQLELVKVWERSVWSEERDEWNLPKIKPRSDFHVIKLPTLANNGEGETGGAEVVSDDEVKDREGSAGGTGYCSERSSVSTASSKRRKSGAFRQPSRAHVSSPYNEDRLKVHSGSIFSRSEAQHISQSDTKTTIVTVRGMSPHNSSNSSKERRKHKDKSPEALELSKTVPYSESQEGQDSQIVSTYKAQLDRFTYRDDRLAITEHQSRDRLQSRHGSRPNSRQEVNTRCATSNGEFRAAVGQLQTSPPSLIADSMRNKIESSGQEESRHRYHIQRGRQEKRQQDEAGDDEWVEVSNTRLSPLTKKKKNRHLKKKKEGRNKAEFHTEDGTADSVDDHVSLRCR
ncbi:putative kinesin-like protein [Plasmopara halstedii]